jgi:hypothetical protein
MELTPMAILLLVPLSMAGSLGVVFGFGLSFVFLLGSLKVDFNDLLLGFSAYIAVLATLLSNLSHTYGS